MRVAVCVTSAVDPEERLEFLPGRGPSNLDGLRRELNRADACALEEALRLKDRRRDLEVFALGMGPASATDVLREALGQGADGAVRLWDEAFAGSDALATAGLLARAARALRADVVICGERAMDGETGQVGIYMAEVLDLPVVTGVVRLEVTDDCEAIADQRLERGLRRRVRCRLPALFTVEEGANRPRYPRLRSRLRAKHAAIPVWGVSELGLEPDAVGQAASRTAVIRLSPPKPTTKGIFVPDRELSAEERLAQILSGGFDQRPAGGQRPAGPLAGSPADQAREIARFLADGKHL
ncbi:MAG: electron transfer flavoprotein subunit beta/FixA family protein [Gemmatimonadales bacterium]|nr:electron transfer flavoprotein subunit beta/FixA family protein [Gemmatimonadales bacterium]